MFIQELKEAIERTAIAHGIVFPSGIKAINKTIDRVILLNLINNGKGGKEK